MTEFISGPGVYQLWNDDRCVYVGMSKDMKVRLRKHKDKNYNRLRFSSIGCSMGRRIVECIQIAELRPLLNKNRPEKIGAAKTFKAPKVDQKNVIGIYCGWP